MARGLKSSVWWGWRMHKVHKWWVVLGGLVSGWLGAALYLLVNCWGVKEGYVVALSGYILFV